MPRLGLGCAWVLGVASAQDDHDGLVAVPNPIQISGIVCESSRGAAQMNPPPHLCGPPGQL